jgi:hypothetical protein
MSHIRTKPSEDAIIGELCNLLHYLEDFGKTLTHRRMNDDKLEDIWNFLDTFSETLYHIQKKLSSERFGNRHENIVQYINIIRDDFTRGGQHAIRGNLSIYYDACDSGQKRTAEERNSRFIAGEGLKIYADNLKAKLTEAKYECPRELPRTG